MKTLTKKALTFFAAPIAAPTKNFHEKIFMKALTFSDRQNA
jgi:hypothetical protein